jgi:hypothetical protein
MITFYYFTLKVFLIILESIFDKLTINTVISIKKKSLIKSKFDNWIKKKKEIVSKLNQRLGINACIEPNKHLNMSSFEECDNLYRIW